MPKKKKNFEDKYVLRKPTEVSAEISYVDEQPVQNTLENCERITSNNSNNTSIYYEGYNEETDTWALQLNDVKMKPKYLDGMERLSLFNIQDMKERMNNGESVSSLCKDMKEFIKQNKDTNPNLVQLAVAKLLGDCSDYYDHGTDNWLHIRGFTRKHLGDSATEVLEKVLNTPDGEELNGFVCSTISEFGMRLLDECGIKAVMLAGGTDSSNHTCLLWQRSDGKYVQSNYNNSYILNVSNMKDAAREVYKNNLGLISNGWIYFIDNGRSWQEFALKEEAMWGDELDKNDYNKETIFNRTMAKHPEISGKASVSNLGSFSMEAKGTVVFGNSRKEKELSWSIGGKKSNFTSIADNSTSIGGKLEYKSETKTLRGVRQHSLKVIADYTRLSTQDHVCLNKYMPVIKSKVVSDPEARAEIEAYYSDEYDSILKNETCGSLEDYIDTNLKTCYITTIDYNSITIDEFGNREYGYKRYDYQTYIELYPEERDNIIESLTQRYNYRLEQFYKYYGTKDEYIQNFLERKCNIEQTDSEFEKSGIKQDDLTIFARYEFGKESTLFQDKNVKLSQGWQLASSVGFNDVLKSGYNGSSSDTNLATFGGDIRASASYGLDFKYKDKINIYDTNVTIGGIADMGLRTGCLNPTVVPGVKINGEMSYAINLKDNVSIGALFQTNATLTQVATDINSGGSIQVNFKPKNSNATIFAGASYDNTQQRIRIGGFNEQTENYNTSGTFIGLALNNKSKISFGYTTKTDFLNPTRNRGTFTVGGSFNF